MLNISDLKEGTVVAVTWPDGASETATVVFAAGNTVGLNQYDDVEFDLFRDGDGFYDGSTEDVTVEIVR